MSELEADNTFVFGEECLAYKKSEADKVIEEKDETIEELKERNDELQKATDSAWSKTNAMYDELNHHKYKRCLGLAQEWRNYATVCGMQSHCHNHRGFGKTAEKYTWKEIHAWKCVKRYKELAEKFKEAK